MISHFPTSSLCTFPDKTSIVVWLLDHDQKREQYHITWQFEGASKQELWIPVQWIS